MEHAESMHGKICKTSMQLAKFSKQIHAHLKNITAA